MIGAEAFGHARKLLALDRAEQALHDGRGGQLAELRVPLGDMRAHRQQRLRRRQVDAAAHVHALVRDREIISRGAVLLHAAPRE